MAFVLFVENTLQAFAAVVMTGLWQGAAIAAGLAIILGFAPRTSAQHRFYVWAAAFVALVALPMLTYIAGFQSAVAGGSSAVSGAEDGALLSRPLFSMDARWSLLIGGLWAVASVFRAGDLILHSFRLRKLWKDALPVEVEGSLSAVPALSQTTGRRGAAEVCTTKTLQRPSVIGFFKPRILIPDWLFARLTPGELEQIVLHEAEHLRRRDDWTNLVQKICLVLFPLNPALVWIERRLCREREMACDDGVVRVTRAPRAYAACLASLAERGLERRAEALSLGAWQRRPELVHRVHSILRHKHTLGPLGNGALLGALGCGLIFGSVELALCPQLVAFVPARSREALAAKRATAMRVSSPLRLVNTAYSPARGSVRKVRGRAVIGGAGGAGGAGARKTAEDLGRTASYKSEGQVPRAILLKAEMPGAAAGRATGRASDEAQATQWIVLTTWEQVEAPHQTAELGDAGPMTDDETGAGATTAQGAEARTGQRAVRPGVHAERHPEIQPGGQITVTRLILRIFPASSISTGPALVPTRNGWFVLQL
jgi:beta-lactamase regulating signal transducer with metallopeptidase domain